MNDTWGHDVGDEGYYRPDASITDNAYAGGDLLSGAFGGDEFAVIMCGTPRTTRLPHVACMNGG
ncbi:diguanylate cyclase [Salmonella enterica subsp. enterica]|nr:diguanylate cyclase [Salmonella enterica subsp. enterica]